MLYTLRLLNMVRPSKENFGTDERIEQNTRFTEESPTLSKAHTMANLQPQREMIINTPVVSEELWS